MRVNSRGLLLRGKKLSFQQSKRNSLRLYHRIFMKSKKQ